MRTIGSGTSVSTPARSGAAASNPYFSTAASPVSLATIMRNNVVVRDAREPISHPFQATEVVGLERRV